MGLSISSFKKKLLSYDRNEILEGIEFMKQQLSDARKFQLERDTTIPTILDVYKEMLDVDKSDHAISKVLLLEKTSIFEMVPIRQLSSANAARFRTLFGDNVVYPIFLLARGGKLSASALKSVDNLANMKELTETTPFLKLFIQYKAEKDDEKRMYILTDFVNQFSEDLLLRKRDRIATMLIEFILMELQFEISPYMKSVHLQQLNTLFNHDIVFTPSLLKLCLDVTIASVIYGSEALRNKGEPSRVSDYSAADFSNLLTTCYDFTKVFLTTKTCFQDISHFSEMIKYVVPLLYSVEYSHLTQKNVDILDRLLEYCNERHLDYFENAYKVIGSIVCSYYPRVGIEPIQEEKLYLSILSFMIKLFQWTPFQDLVRNRTGLFGFSIIAPVIPFFNSTESLKKSSAQLLKVQLDLYKSKFAVMLSRVLLLTLAYYLHPVSIQRYQPNFVETPFKPSSFDVFVSEGQFEEIALKILSANAMDNKSLFPYLNYYASIDPNASPEGENLLKLYIESASMIKKVMILFLNMLFEEHEEASAFIVKTLSDCITEAQSLSLSNLWNDILTVCSCAKLKTWAVDRKSFEEIKTECIDAKEKLDRLTCIICFDYLFEKEPVCLDCGHLFCMSCANALKARDKKCAHCEQPFESWIKLMSV